MSTVNSSTPRPDNVLALHPHTYQPPALPIDWFGEHVQQVVEHALCAFGITIYSEEGKVRELMEMLAFAERVAREGVAGFIAQASYQSGCCCFYTIGTNESRHPDVLDTIYHCAKDTLTQFVFEDSRLES